MTGSLSLLLTLISAQTMSGKPGDPLLRPMIPDPFLIRQQWVQQELNLSPEMAKIVQKDGGPKYILPNQMPPPTGAMSLKPSVAAITGKHAPRLLELSLWANGDFAFTNDWVAKQTGLTPSQRKAIDDAARSYFKWHSEELERLNKRNANRIEISKLEYRTIDPELVLQRLFATREALRKAIPAAARVKLDRLRGAAPATSEPFGFPFGRPQLWPHYLMPLIRNPRVHEELGFTMRESRQTLERLASGGLTEQAAVDKLSSAQQIRYRELQFQMLGTIGVMRHDATQLIGVSDAQLDGIYRAVHLLTREDMRVQNDQQNEYNGLYDPQSHDTDDRVKRGEAIAAKYSKKRAAIRSRLDAVILGLLSSPQRQKWVAIQGKRLEVLNSPAWRS